MRLAIARALGTDVLACDQVGQAGAVSHWRVQTPTTRYFAKAGSIDNLEEARGLTALAEASVTVPRVVHAHGDLLITEWIETEVPMPPYWARLGRALAELHRRPQTSFGFAIDNHLGGTPQVNPVCTDGPWAEYFWRHRLAPMLARTGWEAPGLRERTLAVLGDVDEPPSLVHGDLWSGNVLCGPHQRPVLIDPAPYRGHREVDLAMTELFGGFEPKFYAAYDEAFPRRPGHARRRLIYNLYHLLNHWLLFGLRYRVACEAALVQIERLA